MIFAAGRGDRMRPLTDTCPKPLLAVGGKPLIVWQIEALARAGIVDIVINHAWLGERIEQSLGDGSRFGVRLAYSAEGSALETAGGIAKALPLLRSAPAPDGGRRAGLGCVPDNIFLAVSGDIHCDFDYRRLMPRAERMRLAPEPGMHLVMVPNPPFHPEGDFALESDGTLALSAPGNAQRRLTFGNIGLYDMRSFAAIVPGEKMAMTPLYRDTIARGLATGERFDGAWENVGTPEQLAALDRRLRT